LPDADALENQVFRIDDEWNRSDETEKEDVMNSVLEKRERALRKAREAMDQRYSQGTNPGAVGWLFYFAYENLNAAVNQANIQDSDVSDKLEELVQEFHDALKIRDRGGEVVEEYTPYDMQEWSEVAEDIGRKPAPMRRVMQENGEKIQQLIGFAYSGTEAVTEGSSEDETMGPEGE
jgi:hypothetical protein